MKTADNAVVLVTGATGFVGGALVKRLLRQGYRVRTLARQANNPALQALAADLPDGSLEIFAGDIAVKESLHARV